MHVRMGQSMPLEVDEYVSKNKINTMTRLDKRERKRRYGFKKMCLLVKS